MIELASDPLDRIPMEYESGRIWVANHRMQKLKKGNKLRLSQVDCSTVSKFIQCIIRSNLIL